MGVLLLCLFVGSYLGSSDTGVLLRDLYILANETDGEPQKYKYEVTGLNHTTSYCYTIRSYDGKEHSELEDHACIHVTTDIDGMCGIVL